MAEEVEVEYVGEDLLMEKEEGFMATDMEWGVDRLIIIGKWDSYFQWWQDIYLYGLEINDINSF